MKCGCAELWCFKNHEARSQSTTSLNRVNPHLLTPRDSNFTSHLLAKKTRLQQNSYHTRSFYQLFTGRDIRGQSETHNQSWMDRYRQLRCLTRLKINSSHSRMGPRDIKLFMYVKIEYMWRSGRSKSANGSVIWFVHWNKPPTKRQQSETEIR